MTDEPNKYLFDLYNFDNPNAKPAGVEEEEDLPVVYSEEELEAAKATAYNEGKEKALQESQESREQYISQVLKTLTNSFDVLMQEEKNRYQIFEQEAVLVCLAAIEAALPTLYDKYGAEELSKFILETLSSHENTLDIEIFLNPDEVNEIKDILTQKVPHLLNSLSITGLDDIHTNSCRINWKNGGAIKDSNALIQEICDKLRSPLAEEIEKTQNEADE